MPGEGDTHLRAVVASVCELGLIIEPLKVSKGRIVDGRLRMLGAKAAGFEDVPTVEIAEEDVATVILHSLAARRHLTKSALAYMVFPVIENALAESRSRRLENLRKRQSGKGTSNTVQASGNTAEEIAESMGVSRRYLVYCKTIIDAFRKQKRLREIFEPKILSGELSLEDVSKGIGGWKSTYGMDTAKNTWRLVGFAEQFGKTHMPKPTQMGGATF